MKISISFILLITILSSCYKVDDKIDPKISYFIQEKQLKELPSAFSALSSEERKEEWGKEYLIAHSFVQEFDLYRAITAFKRSEILLSPEQDRLRKLEIQYDIILCYYFGKRYEEVIETFEKSLLPNVDKSFPTFHDLLVILYESYKSTKEKEKVKRIEDLLETSFPETAKNLNLSTTLSDGKLSEINKSSIEKKPYLEQTISLYEKKKKSVPRAQLLNAIIPGSGYLYIGQKKSALTAFLINGLFAIASYEFFNRGYVAAGIITTSFEAGWYFGGIYGAGEEAKFYNERIYETRVGKAMNQTGMFPIYFLQFSF
jgi:tetratricopeptide (TPR) repeat protein